MILKLFLAIALLSSAYLPGCCEAKVVEEHVYLVPAGDIEESFIEKLRDAIPDSLPMTADVEIAPREALPESAYDASRKQYDAGSLLNEIEGRLTVDTRVERYMAVVDVDLYAPDLSFVFGAADARSGVLIISVTRLKNEYYGLKPDDKLFLKRSVKEAVHELGHAWRLSHCPDNKCVMYFSSSLADTDRKKDRFCRECRSKLRARYDRPLINIQF
jgi:archaemetzincin